MGETIEQISELPEAEALVVEQPEEARVVEQDKEKEFIYSFDLAPDQRLELRRFIEDLKNPEYGLRFASERNTTLPEDVYRSPYIQELVKIKFYQKVIAGSGYHEIGDWTDVMEKFGIEEAFFKQEAFNSYRQKQWLERLRRCVRINNPERCRKDDYGNDKTDQKEVSKEEKEEELRYGSFGDSGLESASADVKQVALQGIVDKVVSTSFDSEYRSQQKLLAQAEYEQIFGISEIEFESAIINYIKSLNSYDWLGVDLKLLDKLRQQYSFVDTFLKSPEAKECAQKWIQDKVVKGLEWPHDLMVYFDFSVADFDSGVILSKQRARALDSLRANLNRDSEHLFYNLKEVDAVMQPADWKVLISDGETLAKIENAIACGLSSWWGSERCVELASRIGIAQDSLKKAAVKAIAREVSEESSAEKDKLMVLAKVIGLSVQELTQGITLGAIATVLNHSDYRYASERLKKFEVTPDSDSPEVQAKLKEAYVSAVASVDTVKLSWLEENFSIHWNEDDELRRGLALKQALTKHLDSFNSVAQLEQYIDEWIPDKKLKIFLFADKDIRKSVKQLLADLPFSSTAYRKEKDFVSEITRYFDVKGEVITQLMAEIARGKFVAKPEYQENFKKFYPEINLTKENANCLNMHGSEIVEQAFERKNWGVLEQIMEKFPNSPSAAAIQGMLVKQMDNLADTKKSRAIRVYAVEAVVNLTPQFSKLVPLIQEEETIDNLIQQPDVAQLLQSDSTRELLACMDDWLVTKKNFFSIAQRVLDYPPDQRETFFKLRYSFGNTHLLEFDEKNWPQAIMSYVSAAEDENRLKLRAEDKAKFTDLFNGPYKDVALEGMHKEWVAFLGSPTNKHLSPELFFTSFTIKDAGGAGNLKHVESLGNFIHQLDTVLEDQRTPDRTRQELRELLKQHEGRMAKEKWSQDDRSEFYNISQDILQASPSLYAAFSPVLEQLSPKDMKVFTAELLPLYQAQLVIMQEMKGGTDEPVYKPRQLVEVRKEIRNVVSELMNSGKESTAVLAADKNRLVDIIKQGFKDRFGILQVPEDFSKEDLRSVQNGVRYLGNIANRNSNKEAILAWYLALKLNGKWTDFRQGKEMLPDTYLAEAQCKVIKPILEARQKSFALPLEVAAIPQDKIEKFQELLQEDEISNMMGNIQTIDIKLGNVKRNIEELADPDMYQTELEKNAIRILFESGKAVGAVLAKTYNLAIGKPADLSEVEATLQANLAKIFGIRQWSAEEVKRIQDYLQPFNLISNMVSKMAEEKVDENIAELQKRLVPSDEIIKIFNALGEEFKQESGALALGKDLVYLESLLVKDENKISPEERAIVVTYLDSIHDKMRDLEAIFDKVKEYFAKLGKSTHVAKHELLKDRLVEIEKVIYSQDASAMIISRLTKDLNLIIENMRQCLGCLRKEVNNDTNLAFGDYNKFFLVNQVEKEKGSNSDEIMFFVPVKTPGGTTEMSFTLDRVYGSKSPDILVSNILSIFKKYKKIKQAIPEAKISITVSNEAMTSVGINSELLEKRLKVVLSDIKTAEHYSELVATIPESAFSNNYVEFGDQTARHVGERKLSGLVLH